MQKNILALQFKAELGDKIANFNKVEAMVATIGEKVDILFLPEVWQTGWHCDDFLAASEDENGPTINFLKNLARKYDINIIGGSYIKKNGEKFTNCTPVINRAGALVANYEKNHLFALDGEAKYVSKGEKLLYVHIEGLKIGLSICYDIRFPELFRSFKPMPELLVNLSAWPKTRTHHYTTLCSARAIENQAYFLGLSQTGEIKNSVYNAGNSLLVDPFGETIVQLGEEEDYIFKTIDAHKVTQIREKFPNLAQMRKEPYKIEEIKI